MKKTTLYVVCCSMSITTRAYAGYEGGGAQSTAILLFIATIIVILTVLAYREFVSWRSRSNKKSFVIDETKAMLDKLNNEVRKKNVSNAYTCPQCNKNYSEFALNCEKCNAKLVPAEGS